MSKTSDFGFRQGGGLFLSGGVVESYVGARKETKRGKDSKQLRRERATNNGERPTYSQRSIKPKAVTKLSKTSDFPLRRGGCPFLQRGVLEKYVEQEKGLSGDYSARNTKFERGNGPKKTHKLQPTKYERKSGSFN